MAGALSDVDEALASSETRLGRIKAFAQDALRKRDESSASAAASARAFAALQAEVSTASSMLYQIAIEVSELEAAVASRAADAEYLSKSLPDRETEVYTLVSVLSRHGSASSRPPMLCNRPTFCRQGHWRTA
jgi:predicted  nucleic acid-binding Zn-ribbon protein